MTSVPKPLLIIIAPIAIVFAFFNLTNPDQTFVSPQSSPSMKGVCWVAGDSIAEHNIHQIKDIGTNYISQTPFGFMNGHQSTEVRGNFDNAWWGESDRGIQHTAELARASGVKTMLKPHIWMRSDEGKWRSDIEMESEEDWDIWFKSYGDWIMHYAELAEKCQIESLCIGTELHFTTVNHPDRWRKIIADIRSVYNGELTYAANWYKEFEEIEFWDELDFIGVQAYFPLCKGEKPDKKELKDSWSRHKKTLSKIAKRFDKKIVFTEIGYKNTLDSAKEPWTWPQRIDEEVETSDEMQIICYEALFESVWHEKWFDGMFIWKWFHTTHRYTNFDKYFTERFERRQKRAKDKGWKLGPPVNFTPQRGKALDVLSSWYLGE